MEVADIGAWVSAAIAGAGALISYGVLRQKVAELEKRVDQVEELARAVNSLGERLSQSIEHLGEKFASEMKHLSERQADHNKAVSDQLAELRTEQRSFMSQQARRPARPQRPS